MAEETEKKEVKELRFAIGVEEKIIFMEYFSDNTAKPDSPIFTRFSSCRDYITKHYKGSGIKAVYTGMPDYEKNELEGIINSEEKTTNLQQPS